MDKKEKEKRNNKLRSLIVFLILGGAIKLACRVVLGFRIDNDPEVKKLKKSDSGYVVLCAHPSEFDAIVLLAACFPRYTRFVAGAQQLYKGLQGKFLQLIGVIPKKQFVADIGAVKEMMKTIKSGTALGMMPEGRVSLDGSPNPQDPATAKLLKKMGVPVALLIPHGSFFIKPSYNYKGLKLGKMSAEFRMLFTAEELKELSEEEILDRLEKRCSYDASEELRGTDHRYGSKKNRAMSKVSNILYRCPNCGKLYTMRDDGLRLWCGSCGSSADISRSTFIDGEHFPDTITEWNRTQKDFEKDYWKNPEAAISFAAERSMLVLGKDTDYRPCAKGVLGLDKNGLHYEDAEEKIDAPLESVAGVSADYEHAFITYYSGSEIRRFSLESSQFVTRFVNSLMILKS